MRIAFMGTPDFAVPTLHALAAAGHDVAAVYCQPPRPGGRGKRLQPSPVQVRASTLGIEVRTPGRLNSAEVQADFAALRLDAAVVAAYGLILPAAILEAPRLGCFNVHASLLPRWRGAAPVQRAILAGDELTGVTIMRMERGLDTGPMLAKIETAVDGKTAGELMAELATLGAKLLIDTLPSFGSQGAPQPSAGVTYAAKIDKAETRLHFARPAELVERQVRACNPPGAWLEHHGERIRVLAAKSFSPPAGEGRDSAGTVLDDQLTIACETGAIAPVLVQRAGRAAMTASELLRGFPIAAGTRLG